jgi:hypothetical protein
LPSTREALGSIPAPKKEKTGKKKKKNLSQKRFLGNAKNLQKPELLGWGQGVGELTQLNLKN